MYILFGDETDREQTASAPFFIYGAIFVPIQRVEQLHHAVERLRAREGFRADDSLKFATKTRPSHVSQDRHRDAKRQVLEIAGEIGVRFCAQLVSHDLAQQRKSETLVRYGANTVLGAFNKFLGEEGERGLAIFDRLPIAHPDRFIRDKFQQGLTFPWGSRRLANIICYAHSCDGASHLSSVADIVLGSFRYCVNERGRDRAPRKILPAVARLMWYRREGHKIMLD